MSKHARKPTDAESRVARHRRKLARSGAKRVEVVVPAEDAALVRRLAAALRSGGEAATRIREEVRQAMPAADMAQSGESLVEFFRNSPLVGLDIDLERDRSHGRAIDL